MIQQIPPYADKGYPPQASIHKTKNSAREVQKCCDARCWNEIEEKLHDRYVDIETYETVERSKCIARFLGTVLNRAGRINNSYRTMILVG